MSSTNKTANVGLNQWVRTDPFCMDDFNEDNAKIDTALKSAQIRDKLFDITVESRTANIDIDLSNIDISQYYELILLLEIEPNTNNKYIRLNNYTGSNYWTNYYSGGGGGYSRFSFDLGITKLGLIGNSYILQGLGQSYYCSLGKSNLSGRINTINFIGDPTNNFYYEPGTTITIYGVKI